jgi:predicted RND superfamily exporter protein
MSEFMNRIARFIVEKRLILFVAVLLLTGASAYFLKNLGVENSLDVWFLKNDPVLVEYNEFKKIYGNDEIIVVWVKPDKGVYDPAFVKKIYNTSKEFEKYPLIKRVLSSLVLPILKEHLISL